MNIDTTDFSANQYVLLILPGCTNDKPGRPCFGRIIGGQHMNQKKSYHFDKIGVEHMFPLHGYAVRFFDKQWNPRCEQLVHE